MNRRAPFLAITAVLLACHGNPDAMDTDDMAGNPADSDLAMGPRPDLGGSPDLAGVKGVRTVFIDFGYDEELHAAPDYRVKSFVEAAGIILAQS